MLLFCNFGNVQTSAINAVIILTKFSWLQTSEKSIFVILRKRLATKFGRQNSPSLGTVYAFGCRIYLLANVCEWRRTENSYRFADSASSFFKQHRRLSLTQSIFTLAWRIFFLSFSLRPNIKIYEALRKSICLCFKARKSFSLFKKLLEICNHILSEVFLCESKLWTSNCELADLKSFFFSNINWITLNPSRDKSISLRVLTNNMKNNMLKWNGSCGTFKLCKFFARNKLFLEFSSMVIRTEMLIGLNEVQKDDIFIRAVILTSYCIEEKKKKYIVEISQISVGQNDMSHFFIIIWEILRENIEI